MDMNEKSGITNGWRTPVKLLKRKRERERQRQKKRVTYYRNFHDHY